MNQFDQMTQAMREAEATMRAADLVSNRMAAMLRGRLRNVNRSTLADLKRELKDFNAHTGEWKQ